MMPRTTAAVLGLAVVSALFVLSASTPATSLASSAGKTETLQASADAFVRAGNPNANQGAWSYLRVSATGNSRALVRFDQTELAATVGSGKLVSATLTLDVLRSSGWRKAGGTISIHRLISAWAEGNGSNPKGKRSAKRRGTGLGVTWNCAVDTDISNRRKDCRGETEWEMGKLHKPSRAHPWSDPATAAAKMKSGQSGPLSFDVTTDVIAFLSGEANNDGWIVKEAAESRAGRVQFSSRETGIGPRLVLVVQAGDTKAPEVEPVGLSVQDPIGDYVNGQDVYSVDISATDATVGDTGVARVAVERTSGPELAASDADCSTVCPADYSETLNIDSSGLEEGAYELAATATDGAGNVGTSEPWTLWVDRTAPDTVSNIRIARFDESSGTATVGWDAGADSPINGEYPGSGVQSFEYRYRVGDGEWTDSFWTDFPEFDLSGRALGDVIDVEVIEADAVGNSSAPQIASLTVFAASEPTPWYSDPTLDPGTDVILTEEQSAQAVDLVMSDSRIAPLLEGLNAGATDIVPWSTEGTQATVFGADVTITWPEPVTLEANWPSVNWPEDSSSYTIENTHYRATGVTSLEAFVTFDSPAVVGFQPLDGTVDVGSIEQLTVATPPNTPLPRSRAPISGKSASALASVPDWVHARNPRRISDSNSWFTNGDYFWNYDFDSSQLDLTKKTTAERHGDWPVTVIFTNESRLSLVKSTIWSGHFKSPMYMKLYDRGSDPLKKPVWDKDSGNYLGNACVGTKWHYRLYGPDTDIGGDGSFYNADLGYYVIATTHKDYHDQKGWMTPVCLGGQWSGDADDAEAKLAKAAENYRFPLFTPLRYYPNPHYFDLGNRDMRHTVKNRHYKSDGYATNICVRVTGDTSETCWMMQE